MNVLAFYPLSTNADDLYRRQNGTATSEVSWPGGAATFTRAGAQINVPAQPLQVAERFTISASVNLASYNTLNATYHDSDSGNIVGTFQVRQSHDCAGQLMFTLQHGSAAQPASISVYSDGQSGVPLLSLNTWHDVKVTYERATQTVTFYVDGVAQGATDLKDWFGWLADENVFLPQFGPIGGGTNLDFGTGATLNGSVRDVFIEAIPFPTPMLRLPYYAAGAALQELAGGVALAISRAAMHVDGQGQFVFNNTAPFGSIPVDPRAPDPSERSWAMCADEYFVRQNTPTGAVAGSAFFISPTRIVTAAHVLAGMGAGTAATISNAYFVTGFYIYDPTQESASWVFPENQVYQGSQLHAYEYDQATGLDFAIVDVVAAGSVWSSPTHTFTLSTDAVADDDPISVIGFPLGLPMAFSNGLVVDTTGMNDFEVQARVISGNSGGPVLNAAGHVIGVVKAIPGQPQFIPNPSGSCWRWQDSGTVVYAQRTAPIIAAL